MTYSNMHDFTKQLAEDTSDRISAFETNYEFYPDEVVLINESGSDRVIAAVIAGLTTDFLTVNSPNGRSFREVTQKVIDKYNADNSCQYISTCAEMVFDEFKVTNITFQRINHTLSVIATVSALDLYRSGDVLANYMQLYLLIVSKITKLKVGKLGMCVLDSYVLKKDISRIRDMHNSNTAEVVLADSLTDLNFTGDDVSLKT